MTVLPQAVNFRAIAETYEDTFAEYEGTAADYSAFAYEGDPIERKAGVIATDGGMANGTFGIRNTEVLTEGFDVEHKSILTPDFAGIALTSLGAGESNSTNIHYLKFLSSPNSVTLKQRNIIEKMGDIITQYSGCQITSFGVEADKAGYVKNMAQIRGYGNYKTTSLALSAATMNDNRINKDQFLKFGDATLKTGTNSFSTGVPVFTSTADWKAKLRSFSWSIKANIVESGVYQFGTTTTGTTDGKAKDWPFAGYEVALKAKFLSASVEDATDFWITREIAQTEFALQIPIVGKLASGSDYYSVIALFPRVRVKRAAPVVEDGVHMRNVEFEVIFRGNSAADAADTAIAETFLYVTCTNNGTPASYIAATA